MQFSAGLSGFVHVVVMAAALFGLPAVELAFGDRFGRGETEDVLTYGEGGSFQAAYSSGALTDKAGDTNEDETSGGIDLDDNVDTLSSGDLGFDEVGDAPVADTAAGFPDITRTTEQPAGAEGFGLDRSVEAGLEGTREDDGDTGDAETEGQSTREIVIFVNLAPEPNPDQDAMEPVAANAAGDGEIASQNSAPSESATPGELSSLASDEAQTEGGLPQAGDAQGLAEGETDEAIRTEGEAALAQSSIEGETSPPDTAMAIRSEIEGTSPEDLPVGEESTAAPTVTTAATELAEATSGTADTSTEATTARKSDGQPGLPDHVSEVLPENAPLPEDIVAQQRLSDAVPSKGIAGLDTQAPLREDAQGIDEANENAAFEARLGSRLSGIDERLEGPKGVDNDAIQDEITVASGNLDATKDAAPAEEARSGSLEGTVPEAAETEAASVTGTQTAAVEPGETFRAPREARSDRLGNLGDLDDPLAKVVAAIAGENKALARALTEPVSGGPPGGAPDPGSLNTNAALQRAADAGLARAQVQLAKRFVLGLTERGDPNELVNLLRNPAERGNKEAQLLLGALFADGSILPQDLVQSHVFFELAAAQVSAEAEEILPVIERQMAPVEVVDSRRLAREYKRFLDAVPQPVAQGSFGEGLRDQLLDAAAAGNTAKIAELLSRGADLEGNDTSGRTAVINAAWRGRAEVVDLLIALGADFNVTDYEGRTAVSWAASNGHEQIVQTLLLAGARPNIVDGDGLTPIMRAAWNGHEKVVRALIDAGADLSTTDKEGRSVLDLANDGGHAEIVRILRAFGA